MANGKPLTKTEIFNKLAEDSGLTKKQVTAVFESLTAIISSELSKGKKTDAKQFTIHHPHETRYHTHHTNRLSPAGHR